MMIRITATATISVLFFALIYKNFLFIFLPGILIKLLFIIPFFLLLLFCAKTIYARKFVLSLTQVYPLLLIVMLLILTARTLFFGKANIQVDHVSTSFQQLFVPLALFSVIFTADYNRTLVFRRVLFFSLPMFFFTIVELFLPRAAIETLSNLVQVSKFGYSGAFDLGSYIFQDFGFYYIRTGSLFFEPLTLSLYSSTLFAIYVSRNPNAKLSLLILISSVLSLGKAGFLILLSAFSAKILGRLIIIPLVSLFAVSMYVFWKYFVDLDMNQLKLIFATAGPHIYGLAGGIINATIHPYVGFGIGTAGYLVLMKFIAAENEELFYPPENIIPSNGNESFIGIMLYQTGYIFTALYLVYFAIVAYQLFKAKQFYMVGALLGGVGVSFLSESTLALLLMILPIFGANLLLSEGTTTHE